MMAMIVSCHRRRRSFRTTFYARALVLLWIVLVPTASPVVADQQSPPPVSPNPVTINMTHRAFHPNAVHVLAGSKVIWENDDTQDLIMLPRSDAGSVIVRVVVDAQGQVQDARLAQSSGSHAIDDAVLKSAKEKTFPPADPGKPGIRAYLIAFSYGSPDAAASASPPPFGEVTIKPGGTFSYTFTAPGEYYFYSASDADVGVTVFVTAGE